MSHILPFFLIIFEKLLGFLLSLRYRIKVTGLSQLNDSDPRSILFLANHPAEIDPPILMQLIWAKFKPHPVVVEHFYYQKGLRVFMDLVGAFPLPTMDVPSPWKARQIEKLKQKLIETLDLGGNILIYPSGRLKGTAEERLGAASLTAELLEARPNSQVVLVRTRGLWGSSFSKALTGKSPDFGKTLAHGFKTLIKNGIFFTPRRVVELEFAIAGENFPRQGSKMELNQWLENWYNRDGGDPIRQVSYTFWRETLPEILLPGKEQSHRKIVVSEEISAQVIGYLAKLTRRNPIHIDEGHQLSNDLGLDSLDTAQIYAFLEERFGVTGLQMGQLQTVEDILQTAAGVKSIEHVPISLISRKNWPQEAYRPPLLIPSGDTIPEVFLRSAARMGDRAACADALSGILSYRKLRRSVIVLSREIASLPGDTIGILLPSSVAVYVTILATLLAKKTPAMLNWTVGPRSLEHMSSVSQIETVLTSYRFLSRLEGGDLGSLDEKVYLLEELRRGISLKTKLKGALLSLAPPSVILRLLRLGQKAEETAVILFTSGTEALPKAVPLTHANLLSNQRAALSSVQLNEKDSLYGVLPPFHSFGFSVTGLFPLLAGIKVCYSPDPTDSRLLASDIAHYKPTLFCAAPSFIQSLLRMATDQQLKSLRLVVTGAEKAPQELFDALSYRGKTVLEGYGISECSPIVTIDREGDEHKGVGKPLPGIELCIIHPETEQVLALGEEGEVCIKGPSVFNGYLGTHKSPFIELHGTRWYRSGDRGRIDVDGTLILTGRLKRFVKIGAEMVSLGGLELDLLEIVRQKSGDLKKQSEGGAILALSTSGRESDKPQIILFTIFPLDREEINEALKKKGHGRLAKISEVRLIESIPLTGTGKIHYRLLDEMV